jgi:hypothetical protein
MRTLIPPRFLLAMLFLFTLHLSQQSPAQIPRTLSYQAILTDNAGTPKPDGAYNVTFRLYPAASGGAALWSETQTVQVRRGLFSAVLGSVTPIGAALTFTQPYWLSLQVAPDAEIATRIPLTSVGYSFNAMKADSARYTQGTVAPAPLALTASVPSGSYVLRSDATGAGSGIIGTSNSEFGVAGQAFATSGLTIGVVGNSYSPSGFAMSGWNRASSGNAVGVRGLTDSPSGWGVYGYSAGGLGVYGNSAQYGVKGLASGTSGSIGVWGEATGNVNDVRGVYGLTNSPQGHGVVGANSATSGTARGVWGVSVSPVGQGVYGSGGPNGIGVYGYTAAGMGVYGNSAQYGVKGLASGTNGSIGVWGEATGNVNDVRGVYGTTNSPQGNGVVGANNATSGTGRGVWGVSNSPQGVGVFGSNNNVNGWAAYFEGKTATKALHILGGADLAEPFDTELSEEMESGTVMVIDDEHPGMLRVSASPYDSKVAGIVSGAGGVEPGLTLRQVGTLDGKNVIALAGRVYCKAEAFSSPIKPGDLLTSSSIPGHAMKATDKDRSHGAIIGKAMSELKEGTGLVLVLVNLQ